MILGLIVLCVVLFYVYIKISRRDLIKYGGQIPGDKPLPLIGNAGKLLVQRSLTDVLHELSAIANKYHEHGISRLWIGPKLAVGIWDPEYVEIVANAPQTANKSYLYVLYFGLIGEGMFTQPGGRKWRELRKPFTKSMAKKYIENDYFKIFVRRVNMFRDFVTEHRVGKCTNMIGDVSALTLDIFGESHLGVQLNEVVARKWDYARWIDEYFASVIMGCVKHYFYLWKDFGGFTNYGKKLNWITVNARALMETIIEERKVAPEDRKVLIENVEYYTDFLIRNGREKNLPKSEIVKQLTDTLAAGADTLAVSLSSGLMYMAMFPEVQEAVYREQVAIFGDSDRDITFEDLAGMELLDRVLKETLRLCSPPGVFKACDADLQLGKYTVPKGSVIYTFLYQLHRNPQHWERPHTFYPDHFLPHKEEARPKYAFIPYGIGPRMCAGYYYSIIVSKIVYSTLIRNFKVTTPTKFEDISLDYRLLLSMGNGYPLKFEKRLKNTEL